MEKENKGNYCTTSTDNIPEEDILYKKVDQFKAMADPTRLKILYLLEDKKLCSCQIVNALNKPQPTISHHLSILIKSGLVKWEKHGKWKYFKLSNSKLIKIIKKFNQH
jgi:DNA-binding transcriptional ArsR family regulator